MKLMLPLLLLAVSCGAPNTDVTLSLAGVSMADLETIKAELSKIDGVKNIQTGSLKDGQAVLTLSYPKGGAALAEQLAKSATGLKNVKGCDAASVQVSFDGASKPIAPPPPVAVPPPAVPPPPVVAKEDPREDKKEVKVDMKKDPLAYKMHQLPAGSIALFEGWKINPLGSQGNWSSFQTFPEGKVDDYSLIVIGGTPNADEMAKFFEIGPAYIQQQFGQFLKRTGEQKRTKFGGDDAMLESYSGEIQGKKVIAQVAYIKKKDVAVGVMGVGTEAGFKEYGRSIEIVAQSITITETPMQPGLVGTWSLEKYYTSGAGSNQFSSSTSRHITFYPNSTFTEVSNTYATNRDSTGNSSVMADGGDRGRVVLRGNLMTFHYDNGKTWTGEWKFDGGGGAINLNGSIYLKQ